MGCPIHVWVPMAAALTPAASMMRHRLRTLMPSRKPDVNPAAQLDEMQRWSPVASQTAASKPVAE